MQGSTIGKNVLSPLVIGGKCVATSREAFFVRLSMRRTFLLKISILKELTTMEFILILLAIAGVGILISTLINVWGTSKMGKEGWKEFNKAVHDDEKRKKYNNYMFTCPMCGSKNVKKISDLNRASSIAMFGAASSKIGKQYECDNCKHKW